MHAETVLLVDHGDGQVGELHALLHQGVRPDHQVDGALADPFQHSLAVLPGGGGREQGEGHGFSVLRFLCGQSVEQGRLIVGRASGRRGQQVAPTDRSHEHPRGSRVLAREHFRGRHDRRLVAGLDRRQCRVQRDDGLPRTHVALEQAVHRPPRGQVLADLLDGPLLGFREVERQRGEVGAGQVAFAHVNDALLRSFDASLPVGHPELEREELVEFQPVPGLLQR